MNVLKCRTLGTMYVDLCKVCSLVSLALVHALRFLSCPCLCKVCSLVSDALLVVFRHFNTHGIIVTQVTLCFSPSSKHMFTLSGTDPTAFTLWRGLPRRLKMAAYTPRMRVFRRVKMATMIAIQCRRCSGFATEHFQRKPLKNSDLRCPLSTPYRL